jgi:hypothetical protein
VHGVGRNGISFWSAHFQGFCDRPPARESHFLSSFALQTWISWGGSQRVLNIESRGSSISPHQKRLSKEVARRSFRQENFLRSIAICNKNQKSKHFHVKFLQTSRSIPASVWVPDSLSNCLCTELFCCTSHFSDQTIDQVRACDKGHFLLHVAEKSGDTIRPPCLGQSSHPFTWGSGSGSVVLQYRC